MLTLSFLFNRRHQRYRNGRFSAVKQQCDAERDSTPVSLQLVSVFHPGPVRDALARAAGRRVPAVYGRGARHQRPVRLLRPGHAASGRTAHGVSLQVNRRWFTCPFFLNRGKWTCVMRCAGWVWISWTFGSPVPPAQFSLLDLIPFLFLFPVSFCNSRANGGLYKRDVCIV